MKIDLELIKRKSEHNEGLLEELEEVALHQLQIKKIEFLNTHCRNLKILLLQNNLIERIENLHQLKKLEYLNLALNNITLVENLHGCESLRKLDLTLNFIDVLSIEASVKNLKRNENLRELYLMGNPCAKWQHLKLFVVLHLEQLQVLDGSDILTSDRIMARQRSETVRNSLQDEREKQKQKGSGHSEHYDSINQRKEIYEEIEREEVQNAQTDERKGRPPRDVPPVYTDEGDIRQCNEGHYKFLFDEYSSSKHTLLKLFLPKYLCSSLIQVDVNVHYVRCVIKDKLFQVKLSDAVLTDLTKISRKKYTGELHIKMTKKSYKGNKIFEGDSISEGGAPPRSSSTASASSASSASSTSSASSSSSASSTASFFKKEYSIHANRRRRAASSSLALPSEAKGDFLLQAKETKYSSSVVKAIPSLEKIPKSSLPNMEMAPYHK
ncbi:leucine-rich repeat protein [Plasmodium vivax]|uniref:Leucine-rich repeat protein n=1 Tax=Plasmodium vivax TaxID=5855 RepID=A0A1G4HKZ4_PLAVI|nr:leucine-rich repeat protein [Plasmodium vivax]